jgi:ubiquinone biosynthesis protein COQ9
MTELQDRILKQALPLVVFEGWTAHTLRQAAIGAGLPAIDAERAFPGGVKECISYWSHQADVQLEATLASEYNLLSMKIRERIATAVMVRLQQHQPHREAVRRAIAYLAQPWNVPLSLQLLYRTVDTIWRAAGDRSTDYNFYTKRALLAKVYSTTTMIWLNDDSDAQEDTKEFLLRRIEDVMKIEKAKFAIRSRLQGLRAGTTKTNN